MAFHCSTLYHKNVHVMLVVHKVLGKRDILLSRFVNNIICFLYEMQNSILILVLSSNFLFHLELYKQSTGKIYIYIYIHTCAVSFM